MSGLLGGSDLCFQICWGVLLRDDIYSWRGVGFCGTCRSSCQCRRWEAPGDGADMEAEVGFQLWIFALK